jgi:hypothetical protein
MIHLDFRLIAASIAVILDIFGYYPYLKDTIKKKTTPHLYSWLVWAITQGTATVALIYGGGNFAALSLMIGTVLVLVVFFLSFKYGTRNITRSDTVLLILAILAIIAWWQLNNPVIAILMVTAIDAIGFIPTIRKSFNEPWSETMSFWIIMLTINILTIIAVEQYNFLTVTYSVMLAIGNTVVWTTCFFRRKNIPKPVDVFNLHI